MLETGILQLIQKDLEKLPCKVHGQKGKKVTINIVDGNFEFTDCCCEKFQRDLKKRAKISSDRHMKNALNTLFKPRFK